VILLFNPPAPDGRAYTREGRCTQEAGVWGTQWPPLSLATAAALLRRDGHRVTLRDYPAAGLDSRALVEDLRQLRPAFAIWSTGTPTLRHDLALARLVREQAPEAVTAVIGTHVTVRPEEALSEAALSAVIRGEPEGIIRELCRSAGAFGEVAGLSWRDARDGAIRHNPDAAPLEPKAIPAADWDGLDLDGYRLPLKGRRFLMVAPVRGCPWRCVFCTAPLYYGYRLRWRPVADVVAEMAGNVERYDIREFFIWADTFTADRRYVRELCRAIIESGLRISWTCNSRVDTIDEETLRLMKAAGLWMISYGLESGSDAILAASGKGITVAQSREAVALAHRLGIRVAGHFMFGLPGETEETMAETLVLALTLPIDIVQFYVAAPFPGTALYDEARGKGWLRETMEERGSPPPDRGAAAPGAIPSGSAPAASQNSAVMELPGLPSTRVDAYRRYAYRRFYLRPRAVVRVLSMAELSAVAGIMPPIRRFLRWLG
jgi:anaerobic magnesium-protoporphyrin IX monomethyl ester cyclase